MSERRSRADLPFLRFKIKLSFEICNGLNLHNIFYFMTGVVIFYSFGLGSAVKAGEEMDQ